MRKNVYKMRLHRNRKHLRFLTERNDAETPFCKEQVVHRHHETGLPLLTKCEYTNGNVVFVYYKMDGSGVVDYVDIRKTNVV